MQPVVPRGAAVLTEKDRSSRLRYEISLPPVLEAPVTEAQEIGSLSVYSEEELLGTFPLYARDGVNRQNVWRRFLSLLSALV